MIVGFLQPPIFGRPDLERIRKEGDSRMKAARVCARGGPAATILPVQYDFNVLETTAASLKAAGRHRDALRLYLFMADGDSSLDGGYLGGRIAECYERLGELDAARYWYARAVEENPHVRLDEAAARRRLGDIPIADLIGPSGGS